MIAGIDAGSKFLKIAFSSSDTLLTIEHFGKPEECFESLLASGSIPVQSYVFTGHFGEYLASRHHSPYCDETTAVVESVRDSGGGFSHIVNVGASSIRAIELDPLGVFKGYRENTLCAAGTGSFLDEQMRRMNFDYSSLQSIQFVENAPDIATRCAVFAKSDLIHRQQEGFTREEMWNGLAKGVVLTMLSSSFRGEIPETNILFCGGLFQNMIVREWVSRLVPHAKFLANGNHLVALGAVLWRKNNPHANVFYQKENQNADDRRHVLSVTKSIPYRDTAESTVMRNGNEIRIIRAPLPGEKMALGIDIGSTSTKAVLLGEDGEVAIDIYRKTAGDPICAVREIFAELSGAVKASTAVITACATTGSGRKLAGKIIGADLIVNEITAHFAGARKTDPLIETIFEIGGQDSKYIRGVQGNVADCNMNFVCAAGTGSFIEEQSTRLGFDVRDIGDMVIDLASPHTSDRCTVFMEQDMGKLLREGHTREEVIAGVVLSIAKNYLTRVVGSRPVSGDRIFFQGATARNKGLVAAFEVLTGKTIVVSPYCHVMGAFGAALLAQRNLHHTTTFKGFDVLTKPFDISYETCSSCLNKCTITVITDSDGAKVSYGYKCGRESTERKVEKKEDHIRYVINLSDARAEKKPEGKRGLIAIPRTLSMFNYIPLWRTFFESLGYEVRVSPISSKREKDRGVKIAKSDFCFPMKVALAHAQILAEDEIVDAVFYPTVVSEKSQKNKMPRVFCPYVITYPSVVKSAIHMAKPVIAPSIDFRFKTSRMVKELYRSLEPYGVSKKEVHDAYAKAEAAQRAFIRKRSEEGVRVVDEIEKGGSIGIALIGRPYNVYDRVLNLGLAEYFKGLPGVEVFPFEFLLDREGEESDLEHVYWNYGERILFAAEKIKSLKNIYPVYFTNFGCGPDSFILTRFEKIMKGKPYLIIELDEHGSDTGYQTRIEAFIDVITAKGRQDGSSVAVKEHYYSFWKARDRKLWIPPLHPVSSSLFSAAFRAFGYDSEALPDEDRESYEIGKQLVRGSECLPASTTIGAFVKKMREINAVPSEHAFLMATAEGPCRFGQYMVLHRNILDANGFAGSEIFAPTSTNSYMGMPVALRTYGWDSLVAGDFVFKYICRRRPYELEKGSIDKAAAIAIRTMISGIEKKKPMISLMVEALETMSKVPVKSGKKPLVGIVGEIYVRSNPFCNDDLIRYIEREGGEAWLSPMSEWFIYTAWMERYFSTLYDKNALEKTFVAFKTKHFIHRYHLFENAAKPYLPDRIEPEMERVLEVGVKYIPLIFEGETLLTIARAVLFLEEGASMVVNCSPFGCMPGNITSSVFQRLKSSHDKPVVSLFYDGESDMNRIVRVYLSNILNGKKPEEESRGK